MAWGVYRRHGDKIRVRALWILLFSTPYMIWQMGIMYFSGTTLSYSGGTPIELVEQNSTLAIVAGYLCSILFMCVAPRKSVWTCRVLLPIAWCAAALLFAPLPPEAVTAVFFVEAFVCSFMVGAMASMAAHLFTLETVWRDGVYSVLIGGAAIAMLRNDIIPLGFEAFNAVSLVLIAALCLLCWFVPARITVPFLTQGSSAEKRCSRKLVVSLWFVVALAALLVCFANSFSEFSDKGVAVLLLSSSVCATAAIAVRRFTKRIPVHAMGAMIFVSATGFALAALSLPLPQLSLVACALMGPTVFAAGIWLVFVTLVFEIRPSRFVGAGVGLSAAMVHAGLLEALRDDPAVLFGLYAVCAVALAGLYVVVEPYLVSALSMRGLSDGGRQDAPLEPSVEDGGQEGAPNPLLGGESDAALAKSGPEAEGSGPDSEAGTPGAVFDERLSGQERVLAALVLRGYTESDISREMNISLNTQKSYRKNLYTKLGIHSKRELFEYANKPKR